MLFQDSFSENDKKLQEEPRMRVLAIIGSPRKGNSYRITRQIEEKLYELGMIKFDYLFLKDAHLEPCRGCHNCLTKGEELCPLQDDQASIEQQMLNANGVIFVSPNYACGVTSHMKNLLDRFAYIGHRPRFFSHCALVIATSGGPVGLKQTLNSLSYFAGGGFNIVKKLGFLTPPIPLPPQAIRKMNRQIDAAAIEFFQAMKTKKRPSPTFSQILHFRSFQGIYRGNEKLGQAYFPADYRYWTEEGWLKKSANYFVAVKMNAFKKAFGWCWERIIRMYARKMG
jgi:multimeric flavodoxin WrbA